MDEEYAKGTCCYGIYQFAIGYLDVHEHHKRCNANSNRQDSVAIAHEPPGSVACTKEYQCNDRDYRQKYAYCRSHGPEPEVMLVSDRVEPHVACYYVQNAEPYYIVAGYIHKWERFHHREYC